MEREHFSEDQVRKQAKLGIAHVLDPETGESVQVRLAPVDKGTAGPPMRKEDRFRESYFQTWDQWTDGQLSGPLGLMMEPPTDTELEDLPSPSISALEEFRTRSYFRQTVHVDGFQTVRTFQANIVRFGLDPRRKKRDHLNDYRPDRMAIAANQESNKRRAKRQRHDQFAARKSNGGPQLTNRIRSLLAKA